LGTTTLATLLAVVQFGVYVIQENFERLAANASVPGAAVVPGRLATAVLVHVGVALTLASGLAILHGRLHRREARVMVRERLASALARRARGPLVLVARRLALRSWTPAERFGVSGWARPPPLLTP
jgi:hypothetical protein